MAELEIVSVTIHWPERVVIEIVVGVFLQLSDVLLKLSSLVVVETVGVVLANVDRIGQGFVVFTFSGRFVVAFDGLWVSPPEVRGPHGHQHVLCSTRKGNPLLRHVDATDGREVVVRSMFCQLVDHFVVVYV